MALTREQVIESGHKAWSSAAEEALSYYYDGIIFRRLSGTGCRIVSPDETPESGWLHSADCRCPLCKA